MALSSAGWEQPSWDSLERNTVINGTAQDPAWIPVMILIAARLGPLYQSFLTACVTTQVCNDIFTRIAPYGEMPSIPGYERHHLIEQRFAQILGINPNSIPSIYLTPEEHDLVTLLWRNAIGYARDLVDLTTSNATRIDIWNAAQRIYSGQPDVLTAIQIFLFGN